jgi:flagellar basal body-associated protein FliL
MKNLKLIVPIVLVLLGGGGAAYKFVLAPAPAKAGPKPKVHGHLVPLDSEFVVNLAAGRYAKVSVTLLLAELPAGAAGGGHGGAAETPALEQGPLVRAIVTDELTGLAADDLVERDGRHKVQHDILKALRKETDLEVDEVLFTDVVVQ